MEILDSVMQWIVAPVAAFVWLLHSRSQAQAGGLLAATDWYVTRKAETGADIPAGVLTYRQAVRTASNAIEAAIEGAADHAAFVALFDTPVDAEGMPTGNAPISDWPEV